MMDWFIIISILFAGIFWLIYVIRSNRNDYETAIKSKDWQNNLRDDVNFFRVNNYFIAILLILFAFFLVYIKVEKKQHNTIVPKTVAKHQDTSKNSKPIFGYRFIISGDFDGDGKKEKLVEHYFSGVNHKEVNKFYDNLPDYEQLVALTIKKKPYSFVTSDNKSIDTLPISSKEQLLGLSYLKNEGDLNGDGTDEVSYVANWADWSNLNTWHIMTFTNKKWQELYSFAIWDSQLPDLPETFSQCGLFGLENKMACPANDTMNKRQQRELKDFKGLVKKSSPNKIQITYRNDEGELDTLVVNLKKLK